MWMWMWRAGAGSEGGKEEERSERISARWASMMESGTSDAEVWFRSSLLWRCGGSEPWVRMWRRVCSRRARSRDSAQSQSWSRRCVRGVVMMGILGVGDRLDRS